MMRSLNKINARIVLVLWDPEHSYQSRLLINLMKHFTTIYIAGAKGLLPPDEIVKTADAILCAQVPLVDTDRMIRLNPKVYFRSVYEGFNLVELLMGLRITPGELERHG